MSKEIYQCQKEIYPRAQHYTRCVPCKKARKDNALVRSSAGGKSLLAKQHAKRKKSLAKGKKARAHSARVRVNFDDDSTMPVLSSGSADDNNSFSSDSAASSDAASSRGLKMSKKTRQKARARANAALSTTLLLPSLLPVLVPLLLLSTRLQIWALQRSTEIN